MTGPAAGDAPDWFVRNVAVTPDEGTTVVDGCPIRWLRWGSGGADPLVLVHGGGASSQWWVPLAPFLATDRQVVAVDLSGMGDSGWRAGGYQTEGWAAEVLACAADATGEITRAATAGRRPVLVGHSLGGSVVAVAAALHPGALRAVVLCDTGVGRSLRTGRDGRHYRNRLTYPSVAEAVDRFRLIPRQDCPNRWMVEHLARTSVRPVGPGGPDDPTRPDPGTATAWTWKFDWQVFARTYDRPFAEYLDVLASSGVPVACINGEQSRLVTPEVAARLAGHLPAAVHTSVPEARHHLMVDQPLAFVAALRTVLAGLARPTGAIPDGTVIAPA